MYAFTTVLSAVSALVVSVRAAPMLMAPLAAVQLTGRDVVAPPITSPNASTTWNVGETVTVTWDTSDLPPESQITNKEGKIVLGYQTEDSMHLQYDNPLAQGFSITLGSYNVTVPDVEERSDYIIVLFGDSGNSSPKFTITGGFSPGSSSVAPTTTANEARETTASDEVTALTSIISTPIPITGTKSLSSAANIPSGTIVTETSVAQATTAETVTQSDVTTTESSSPSSTSASSAASSSSSESSSSANASGTSAAADSEPSNGALRMLPGSTSTASSLCAATILFALVF
ncbi:uncharacterized protein SCHCODRAFT_02616228 [Schizophyllum commune H4-8]|uniref:uncharacterized protein n=1 Tax=Schizophyllum commune (strain H4-8 / FGSC 9210) TaxID=578458 RepID=UPI00215FB74E|nr:uncharacterized protein SCHCODRAFT_02616228 [Schizophyllum commune H4-8]KAI5896928.1 hypothetical protein SCHCODRAFT_02616228 [Schizophyllum commune H4-8]